jgi:hypothetical protein
LTARPICPFCNKLIIQSTAERDLQAEVSDILEPEAEPLHDPNPSDSRAAANGKSVFRFHILESFSRSDDWISSVKSHLPKSRRGWLELVAIISGALTAIGVLLALFPSVPAAAAWRLKKILNHPPNLRSIECERYVLQGQKLHLRARAEDPDGDQLKFEWQSSPGGRIEGNGAEVDFGTDAISPQTVPIEVIITVSVSDRFGEATVGQERISVVPRKMAASPPVFKIPPRCNCTNLEIQAGESVSFYALAEDEDRGAQLTYDWESSSPAAQIINTNSTTGSTVILNTSGMNPKSSAVPIKLSLRVSDGRGGDVVGDVTIVVLPRQPPGNREASPPLASKPNHPPKLEAFTTDRVSFEPGQLVTLWAFVTDPDGDSPLYYDWRSSAGEIQHKGETAILNTSGVNSSQVIVIVTVSDGHGGSTSQKMFLTTKPPTLKEPSPSPKPNEGNPEPFHYARGLVRSKIPYSRLWLEGRLTNAWNSSSIGGLRLSSESLSQC